MSPNEFIPDPRFWAIKDAERFVRQRVSVRVWRDALLNEQDTIVAQGRVRKLVAEKIGCGVVEVKLKPEKAEVPDE